MKHRLVSIFTVTLFLLAVFPAWGADEWQLIQTCAEIVPRRDDWEDVILLTDWAGVHGISAAYPTPYVMAFIRWEDVFRNSSPGLSPDGRWYAVGTGFLEIVDSFQIQRTITALRVYSTENPQIVYSIDWDYTYTGTVSSREMHWIDNEHILLDDQAGMAVLNFRQGEVTRWESTDDPLATGYNFNVVIHPAPGMTRAVRDNSSDGSNSLDTRWYVVELPNGRVLNGLDTPLLPEIRWTPDGSLFAAEIATPSGDQIGLFDRDGSPVDPPIALPEEQRIFYTRSSEYRSSAWSAEGRYFAFLAVPPNDRSGRFLGQTSRARLYIADRETHTLLDPCIENARVGMAWSPDSRLLAFDTQPLRSLRDPVAIYVFDPQTGQMFLAAYHTAPNSGIIGWRPS